MEGHEHKHVAVGSVFSTADQECCLQGRMQDALEKQISGFENWTVRIDELTFSKAGADSMLPKCSVSSACSMFHGKEITRALGVVFLLL